MKSFFSMFTKSAKELTNPVNLVKVGMLIAISMVIEMYSIDLTFFKINFAFLAIAVIGMLFGPTVGLFAGLICDVVGYMVHPNGAFLPAYTLVAGLQGLIYGICLYTKNDGHSIILRNNESKKDTDITLFLRIIIARLIDVVLINIFINTALNLHYHFITEDSYSAAVIARVTKNVVEYFLADLPLMFVLMPAALLAHKKTGGFKRKKTAKAA